jgi:hypothetical protein
MLPLPHCGRSSVVIDWLCCGLLSTFLVPEHPCSLPFLCTTALVVVAHSSARSLYRCDSLYAVDSRCQLSLGIGLKSLFYMVISLVEIVVDQSSLSILILSVPVDSGSLSTQIGLDSKGQF